jgi:hypothetical protein
MRRRWLVLPSLAVLLAACGGGDTFIPRRDGGGGNVDLAGRDFAGGGQPDGGGPPDFATPLDFTVPDDMEQPPDMGPCTGPEGCPQNAPVCCADVAIGPGNIPNCPIQSVTPMCVNACATNLPIQCPYNARAALCHVAADCTDGNYPYCCLFKNGGTPITACVSALYKQIIAAQCF